MSLNLNKRLTTDDDNLTRQKCPIRNAKKKKSYCKCLIRPNPMSKLYSVAKGVVM